MAAKPLEPARKNKGATSSRHDERMMAAKKNMMMVMSFGDCQK
jgi:hypothetical protein